MGGPAARLGRHRRIVGAAPAWLLRNRRLIGRYERIAEHFEAFATIGAALVCYRRLVKVTS
jgi:hypothetical protein